MVFRYNDGGSAGAITIEAREAEIEDCIFEYNEARSDYGAGMYLPPDISKDFKLDM